MARIHCRWRNVLICVCSPCICLALLFVYVFVTVCMSMNSQATMGTVVQGSSLQSPHYVASKFLRNHTVAEIPKTFWKLQTNGDAIWNQLQLVIDRLFNPILRPKTSKKWRENSTFHESILTQSFSKVISLDSTLKNFDALPQNMREYVSQIERRDYPAILQPKGVCGAGADNEKKPPLLLFAIKTTELNFKNRQAIRHTWGKVGWVAGQERSNGEGGERGGYIRRVFLLAREDPEELGANLTEVLQMESEHYGDILQWDFKETFFNLTLKDVLFWSWFSRSCNQTQFVFKGDDDVFVNTPKLITYLQDQLEQPQAQETIKDFMIGDVIGAATPNRVGESKYFIPESFYKGLYPAYAGGGGVVYSGLLTKRLHEMSKRVHLFPIDDVYVGMCMVRLKAQPIHHPAFLTFDFPEKEEQKPCAYHKILLVHKRSPSQLLRLWDDLQKTQKECRDVALR